MGWISPLWRRPRAGVSPSLTALREGCFVAVDLETTGLDPRRDAIVAAAAVEFCGGEPRPAYVTLVNPGRPIPPASTMIHGITDEMVDGAPPAGLVLAELEAALAEHVVVGHGVAFDLAILARERRTRGLPGLTNPAVDTMRLAAALFGDLVEASLESVAARLGVEVVARHTAHGDAMTAGRLLLALIPSLEALGVRTLGELLWLQDSLPTAR